MSTTTVQNSEENVWIGGDVAPFGVSYGKMMMWFFLVSDAFTFASFLIAYGGIRFGQNWWPDPNGVFNAVPGLHGMDLPLVFVTIMTFILIISSVTMVLAVYEGHHGNRKAVMKYLFFTILGGSAFLGCQAIEWTHLIHNGMTLFYNPFGEIDGKTVLLTAKDIANGVQNGPAAFGALFFVITGFHGSHVLSGIVLLVVAFANTVGGTYEKRGHYEMVEKIGLYWHFVDLVWVFVFLVFYLI